MPLSIDQLTALGLSHRVVNAWRERGIRALLPLQEKALAAHGFLHGANLLVFAPTSSGKTFIAEMAALKHLEQNRRVVYLVPTKALAEEKYRAFCEIYGPLGFRIAVATRERPLADAAVFEGRYDLLVAVYEKMKAYLISRPEMLKSVGLVIADEIQAIGEPGRGAAIDLLLTKICRAPYKPQLIGLSAVLGDDAGRLAAWSGCNLLVCRERPLELREGVFDCSRNLFVYRCFNTGERGEEILDGAAIETDEEDIAPEETPNFRREALLALARTLAEKRDEQALVFVPTRYLSRNWAHHLAACATLPPAEEALEALRGYEDTLSRNLLRETLRQGIAFHNADLSWDLRDMIEHYFNTGSIRILVSTSTLGQGVNLSGRNVLHVPVMVTTDPWTQRHAFLALSRSRFHNQGGRGARFSREIQFGRSILVARNPLETERLLRDYIEGEMESLSPQITTDALDIHLLDLAASRVARSRPAMAAFLQDTFSGRIAWEANAAQVARKVEESVEALARKELLVEDAEGMMAASGLGEVAAATGLRPASVSRIASWLREGPKTLREDPVEALVACAGTPDGREFPAGWAGAESSASAWVEPLRERLLRPTGEACSIIREALFPPGGFTREMLQDLRKALVLDAWIGPLETREIEEWSQIFSGTIANLASHFAWLTQGAAAIARALTAHPEDCRALEILAERLILGCGPEGMAFRSLRAQGFSRAYLQILLREGFTSLHAIRQAGPEVLSALIPLRVAQELCEEVERALHTAGAGIENRKTRRRKNKAAETKETEPAPLAASPDEPNSTDQTAASHVAASADALESALPPAPVRLEVDLRGTGRARLQGRDLDLPPLAFRLLTILARHPETGVSYEEIERYVWPDAHVERQQVLSHRTRILRSFSTVLSPGAASALISVKAGRGLRLNLKPEAITLQETP